ncbi:nuclear transport factor 2 family protein [Spirillospora sp. NPDC050679]
MSSADQREQVLEATMRWARAERAMDAEALAEVLDEDFAGVGPLGFVLARRQWLERYEGGLSVGSFDWRDTRVRMFGDTAVVIGTQVQEATYRGQPSDGRFRGTHVLVRRGDRWRVASIHLSPQQQP